MYVTCVIFEKPLKAGNRPTGENSTNLVTLVTVLGLCYPLIMSTPNRKQDTYFDIFVICSKATDN
jgi:hypothetical protein